MSRHEESARARIAQSQRPNAQSAVNVESVVESMLAKVIGPQVNNMRALTEKIVALSGTGKPELSAVRVEQLLPVMQVRSNPRSTVVDAPVSVDDFNLLVEDVRELYLAIKLIAENLTPKG